MLRPSISTLNLLSKKQESLQRCCVDYVYGDWAQGVGFPRPCSSPLEHTADKNEDPLEHTTESPLENATGNPR